MLSHRVDTPLPGMIAQKETFGYYGPDGQRWKTVLQKNSSVIKTVIFAGDYEKITEDGVTRELVYLPGGGIYVKQSGQSDKIYYTHTDHLGSIVSITDGNGAEVFKASYDAWGKQTITNNTFKFHRGYTRHEHLPEFGLINMNGRMYDPMVGRFLSPDPFVQAPEFSQSFNRYSYCLNNPLIYTDPTGEFWWFVVGGAILGSYVGGGIQSGKWNYFSGDFWKDGWQGAIAGAFVGAMAGAMIASVANVPGVTTTLANGNIGFTKAFGITSTMLNGASMNIANNAIFQGGWNGAWKAGIVGALSGGWSATNGLGMLPKGKGGTFGGKLARRLGYQMIGTAGQSIGNNWAMGEKPFSKVTLGVGPVNLTLGKNQKLLQWQNNLGNIAFNGLGLANLALGGKISFDKEHLVFNYSKGLLGKFYSNYRIGPGATGAYATITNESFEIGEAIYVHEIGHIWQSRGENDIFLFNYLSSGIFPLLNPKLGATDSYYEQLAELFKYSIWGK